MERKNFLRNYFHKKTAQLKEFIHRRWIYCIAFVFNFIIPLVIIGFKVVSVKAESLTPSVSVSFSGMIVGIIYFAFVAKKVKAKVESMEQGALKLFLKGIKGIIPFAVAACIFEVIEKALEGAAFTAWCVIACLGIGTLIQMIDWEVNKEYLYAREIDNLAKKEVDIELRKQQLIEQQQREQNGGI